MPLAFIRHHTREILVFGLGLGLAALFVFVPELHALLRRVDSLGYLGMFLAGLMYGSGLTSTIAVVIFVEAPSDLNPWLVGLIGGLGSAIYDLTIFYVTRREAQRGWLASTINRLSQYRRVPNWMATTAGVLILVSPLPDELAAGLFGLKSGRARTFFLYSFASNAIGILILNGLFTVRA